MYHSLLCLTRGRAPGLEQEQCRRTAVQRGFSGGIGLGGDLVPGSFADSRALKYPLAEAHAVRWSTLPRREHPPVNQLVSTIGLSTTIQLAGVIGV